MNRAARISSKAPSGACWCSEAVWRGAEEQASPDFVAHLGLVGEHMGSFQLKGVQEEMQLVQCSFARAPVSTFSKMAQKQKEKEACHFLRESSASLMPVVAEVDENPFILTRGPSRDKRMGGVFQRNFSNPRHDAPTFHSALPFHRPSIQAVEYMESIRRPGDDDYDEEEVEARTSKINLPRTSPVMTRKQQSNAQMVRKSVRFGAEDAPSAPHRSEPAIPLLFASEGQRQKSRELSSRGSSSSSKKDPAAQGEKEFEKRSKVYRMPPGTA